MSSTVFITNIEPTKSYSEAAEYGAIRAITTGNYPIFKTARLVEEIASALAHSSPDDYLVLSGSGTVAGLCLAMWLEKHKIVRLLLWDQRKYSLRIVKRETLRLQLEQARDSIEARKEAGS